MIRSNSRLIRLQEPKLEFRFGQLDEFAKDGLLLFGPPAEMGQPREIRYGAIGTSKGLRLLKEWVQRIQAYIPSKDTRKLHFQYWPGFSAVFNSAWHTDPLIAYTIGELELSKTIRLEDRHHAVYDTATLIEQPILRHRREEERQPDVWFVVVPEEVYQYGRPKSTVPRPLRESAGRTLGQAGATAYRAFGDLFDNFDEEARKYQFDLDFHAQLKARLLGEAVVQIVRESTLTGGEYIDGGRIRKRRMQDPASTAWNLCTTTYFKAQGSPWRLAGVRKGVCYIGLVYKRDDTYTGHGNICCGAQMFLDSGDGLVFRGAMGPWDASHPHQYHLSEAAANQLMSTVVQAYGAKHGQHPKEIFIHGRTGFNDDEWAGFSSGVPKGTLLTGVKIRKTNQLKIYRAARKPLVRGTAWIQTDCQAYLWTGGYIPRLATYPGFEVPNPLEIHVQRGEADIGTVLQDVLGLTKLNYNACIYGDSRPVTLRFADAVGNILTATPEKGQPPLPFKFYI